MDKAEAVLLVAETALREVRALKAKIAQMEASKPPPPENGKDGVGVAGALIDNGGDLVLTLSDGSTRNLGPVRGKDGKDGRDGFDLESFDVIPGEDGRTVTLAFQQGEVRHSYELVFPVVIDRGIYKAGETYEHGDGVTWGGSYWIAQRETDAKPDSPDSGWRLAVKRGRDGKDAKAA